ncbi:MAG: isocitrate/isopropylmalate family dehydrogenase [Treponema sp.]|nr:isocitrate/isopropylmalate family dehydrogenase [Treponema sp.]MCL2252513.1 isocitrate/isopropylmalate family dehydrogenase [Treponema sp.]
MNNVNSFVKMQNTVTSVFDILIVKDKASGIYFGERGRIDSPCSFNCGSKNCAAETACEEAYDTEKYSRKEIERVLIAAYEKAQERRKKLCIVDKADILESSRLWRETAGVVSKNFPQIETSFLYIEEAAAQLILTPQKFDVIATSNLFGDILCSEITALAEDNQNK